MDFHDVKLTGNLNPSKGRQKKFISLRSLKKKFFRLWWKVVWAAMKRKPSLRPKGKHWFPGLK
jgi:hypothetical protein